MGSGLGLGLGLAAATTAAITIWARAEVARTKKRQMDGCGCMVLLHQLFCFSKTARRSSRFSAFFSPRSHIYSHHHLHRHTMVFLRFCILRSFVDAATRQSEVEWAAKSVHS